MSNSFFRFLGIGNTPTTNPFQFLDWKEATDRERYVINHTFSDLKWKSLVFILQKVHPGIEYDVKLTYNSHLQEEVDNAKVRGL